MCDCGCKEGFTCDGSICDYNELKITKTGKYITRDGRFVEVSTIGCNSMGYPVKGMIDGEREIREWARDGRYIKDDQRRARDLIAVAADVAPFQVTRTGRYRTRGGAIATVTKIGMGKYQCVHGTIEGDHSTGRCWNQNGGWSSAGMDKKDLISYLGVATIVTGPGEYRARNGKKVVLDERLAGIAGKNYYSYGPDCAGDAVYTFRQDEWDIVARWSDASPLHLKVGGCYRTRDGRKAWVRGILLQELEYPYLGEIEGYTEHGLAWSRDGHAGICQRPNDLIAVWEEPVDLGWFNVYPNGVDGNSGACCYGDTGNSEGKCSGYRKAIAVGNTCAASIHITNDPIKGVQVEVVQHKGGDR